MEYSVQQGEAESKRTITNELFLVQVKECQWSYSATTEFELQRNH